MSKVFSHMFIGCDCLREGHARSYILTVCGNGPPEFHATYV